MNIPQSPVEIFRSYVAQARQGELTFDLLTRILELAVAAENHPLAIFLYREWFSHRKGEARILPEEHARASKVWTTLKRHDPDIPELPSPANWLRFDLHGRVLEYRDITDPYFMSIIGRIRPHTLTMMDGVEAPWTLYKAIEYIVQNRIPGDLVECGVWNGGSILLMALALEHFGDTSRRIFLYDTFEGMPQPSDIDRDWHGVPAKLAWEGQRRLEPAGPNWGFGGTVDMVEQVVFSSGYPRENFVFVKGRVEETIPAQMPERAALVRLDTDFYTSTYHELVHLYPVLATGGILIIDDYGYFQGARIATDTYIAERRLRLFLSRITPSVRLAVKPEMEDGSAVPGKGDEAHCVCRG